TILIDRSGSPEAGACAFTLSWSIPLTQRVCISPSQPVAYIGLMNGGGSLDSQNKGINAEILPDKKSGDQAMCKQKRSAYLAPRTVVPPKSRRTLPQRQRRRFVAGNCRRGPFRLRLRDGRAPPRPRLGIHFSARQGNACRTGCEGSRLPHPECRRVVGSIERW